MYVLGIKPFGHDTAAALVKDEGIIAASAQERFDRVKHSSSFPVDAIKFCLAEANINANQIAEIAIAYNYDLAITKLFYWRALRYLPQSLFYLGDFKKILTTKNKVIRILREELKYKNKISFLDHHDCHAASVYLCSPFNQAAVLTIDGRGEWDTSRIYLAQGNQLEKISQIYYPHSIGLLYENVTEFLGFKRNSDEGKIMALASFGSRRYYSKFQKIYKNTNGWKFRLNLKYFNHHLREQAFLPQSFIDLFGNPRKENSLISQRHKDIAASLQTFTNELILAMAQEAKHLRGDINLCIGGGVGLNAVANGEIYKENLFKNIFVQPASGDDGSALGAALLVMARNSKKPKYKIQSFSPYLGIATDVGEIEKAIVAFGTRLDKVNIRKIRDAPSEAAKQIALGKIIGWFQGKAEFGPRALGNRSILADPRNPKMSDILNSKVKFREKFRPFAPSVLEDYANEYFKIKQPVPYMTVVVEAVEAKINEILAVIHVDKTARVQTVSEPQNPKFYRLIKRFFKIAGVPIVLNTSFNVRGEPIVNKPTEAIECFMNSGIDILYVENYEFKK